MLRLTEEQTATLSREARRASLAIHRRYAVPLDDLRQEAWAAMLSALPSYRDESGPFGAYLYAVALSACQRYAWKAACLTAAPRRKAAQEIARQKATCVDVEAPLDAAPMPTPFDALDASERAQGLARLIGEHLAAYEASGAVLAVLSGEATSAEAAQLSGLPVARLYYLTKRAKASMRHDKRFHAFL